MSHLHTATTATEPSGDITRPTEPVRMSRTTVGILAANAIFMLTGIIGFIGYTFHTENQRIEAWQADGERIERLLNERYAEAITVDRTYERPPGGRFRNPVEHITVDGIERSDCSYSTSARDNGTIVDAFLICAVKPVIPDRNRR